MFRSLPIPQQVAVDILEIPRQRHRKRISISIQIYLDILKELDPIYTFVTNFNDNI